MALGVGPGDPNVMLRKPRPTSEPILIRRHWLSVAGYGALIALSVLASFALAFQLGYSEREAVTLSFFTLAFAQLWNVFNMRKAGSGAGQRHQPQPFCGVRWRCAWPCLRWRCTCPAWLICSSWPRRMPGAGPSFSAFRWSRWCWGSSTFGAGATRVPCRTSPECYNRRLSSL